MVVGCWLQKKAAPDDRNIGSGTENMELGGTNVFETNDDTIINNIATKVK